MARAYHKWSEEDKLELLVQLVQTQDTLEIAHRMNLLPSQVERRIKILHKSGNLVMKGDMYVLTATGRALLKVSPGWPKPGKKKEEVVGKETVTTEEHKPTPPETELSVLLKIKQEIETANSILRQIRKNTELNEESNQEILLLARQFVEKVKPTEKQKKRRNK